MKKNVIESNFTENTESDVSVGFQKKESALWKCAFIVFVGSLFLIAISAVSHMNSPDTDIFSSASDSAFAEEYREIQNSQETVSALLEENQRLKKELEIQRIKAQNFDGLNAQKNQIELLTKCRNLFSDARYQEAYDLYKSIDSSLLTEVFSEEYKNLFTGLSLKLKL